VHNVVARNFADAYHETLWKLRVIGKEEMTRNGVAVAMPEPFMLTVNKPWERVVSCPIRNANPFFHVMEVVWMFAGSRDVVWLEQFNKRIRDYANNGVIHGAYGYRWFCLWGDQVEGVIRNLRNDPHTRQAVIQMWDPMTDWSPHWNDRPCNTQLMFRLVGEGLEMTVINRSNDLVWGMFGANCVHMSYIHEFIARAAGLQQGRYHVFTNNLHFYRDIYPNGSEIWDNLVEHSIYGSDRTMFPIISLADSYQKMRHECIAFMAGFGGVTLPWLKRVAEPMRDAYLAKTKEGRMAHASLIEDEAWRIAATQWLGRLYEQ
jgi:Thymidylate synthase